MNVLEFLKFLFPEYQILNAVRLYGLISLKEKKQPEQQAIMDNQPYVYQQAILVPVAPKQKVTTASFFRFILFAAIMAYPLYFITTFPANQIEDIYSVYKSGYVILEGSQNVLFFTLIFLLLSLSIMRASFRKMYYRLPWLIAYIIIMTLNSIILAFALSILNLGHHVINSDNAVTYFLLMSGQIVFCRLLMCILLFKKPVTALGGGTE